VFYGSLTTALKSGRFKKEKLFLCCMNFKNKIILAPIAGVTDIAFRKVCTYCGADIVYSQMIDSRAYINGNRKLEDFDNEKNAVAQLLGNDAKTIAKCAKMLTRKVPVVDLNLGCPKVSTQKAGGWLMREPKKAGEIVRAMVKSADKVTVKIRAGKDKKNLNAVEIAKICEDAGAIAIAVHGRAYGENYEQPVRYGVIKDVKEAVAVPVIGNGNIFCGEDAKRMYELTGCDSVMIGRGAIGNPGVFSEIKSFFGAKKKEIDRKKLFLKYLRYAHYYNICFAGIKKQAQWFTKGEIGGAKIRAQINNAQDVEELKDILGN